MSNNASSIGQRAFNQLIIPGSHDSATYVFAPGGYPRTQDSDLYAQAVAGMRSFDIRGEANAVNTQYVIHHGSDWWDQVSTLALNSVFDDLLRFTNKPGAQNEVLFLDLSLTGASTAQTPLLRTYCNSFETKFAALMLTPAQLVANIGDARAAPRFRSLNEIWSLGLPIQPRVIVNWPGCVQVMDQTTPGYGFWQQLKWPTGFNDSYYANQGLGDCIVYGLGQALRTRGRGDEALPKLTAEFGCNANGVGTHVEGLYTVNLQETGFVPTLGASKAAETNALNAVVNWFRNNQYNARAGLNYITGDFVDFAGDCCTAGFPLAALAVGLNKPTASDPYADRHLQICRHAVAADRRSGHAHRGGCRRRPVGRQRAG